MDRCPLGVYQCVGSFHSSVRVSAYKTMELWLQVAGASAGVLQGSPAHSELLFTNLLGDITPGADAVKVCFHDRFSQSTISTIATRCRCAEQNCNSRKISSRRWNRSLVENLYLRMLREQRLDFFVCCQDCFLFKKKSLSSFLATR